VDCWEEKIGIKNSSETRNFELNFQFDGEENKSTIVYLDEPPNHFSGSGNVTLRCEAYDLRKITNLSLYINISGWALIITNNFCEQGCFLEYSEFFSTGKYEWNCLAVGGQSSWAKENFTFDIINEAGQGPSGEPGGSEENFSDGLGNVFGKSFLSSLGACQKLSKRCWSSSVLQRCIEGKWGNLQFCAYGCDPYLLKCRVCKEGQRTCSQDGYNVEVCSNDSWKTQICEVGCEYGECMSGSQDTNERELGLDFFFIFGIPLVIILIIMVVMLLVRHKNKGYLDRNTKLMEVIKNEI